jgi:hypothetical protein
VILSAAARSTPTIPRGSRGSGDSALNSYIHNRKTLTLGNGNGVAYDYNGDDTLKQLKHDLQGTTTTHDVTYDFGYNQADEISSRQISTDSYAWTGAYNVNRPYVAKSTGPMLPTASTNIPSLARAISAMTVAAISAQTASGALAMTRRTSAQCVERCGERGAGL